MIRPVNARGKFFAVTPSRDASSYSLLLSLISPALRYGASSSPFLSIIAPESCLSPMGTSYLSRYACLAENADANYGI